MIKIGTALFEACEQLEREKGIGKDVIIASLKDAMVAAYKRHLKMQDSLNEGYAPSYVIEDGRKVSKVKDIPNVEAIFDESTGEIGVFRTKLVVENVSDPDLEISIQDAKELDEDVELDDEVQIEVTPENFGRIAAQSAKQVITQRIKEAERNLILNEFMEKKGTLTTGIIQRVENRNVIVSIGKTDALLLPKDQIPGAIYKVGSRIRVYVVNVKDTPRNLQVLVSHAHPAIVKELFELEVPEIEDGIVEIKAIARDAGFRTKIAVASNDPEVDSVGACIGPRGSRIQTILGELNNEKIDIVRYSEDPVEFIVNTLSPARVASIDITTYDDGQPGEALVVVPDDQLSLAIGRGGQNVKLAHRLTGWRIDIKSISQMEAMEAENKANEGPVYEEENIPENEEDFSDEQNDIDEENENQEEYALDEEDIQQFEGSEENYEDEANSEEI